MAKVGKSPLQGKLQAAFKAHAKDETTYGLDFSELPAGIVGGIAQLTAARRQPYKKGALQGNDHIYLEARVLSPKTFLNLKKAWVNGEVQVVSSQQETIEGRLTSKILPLCDTKNANGEVVSVDENVSNLFNELRKLGGDECTADIDSEESLDALLESLAEAEIKFKFNTRANEPTKDYPNWRVWVDWSGTKNLEEGAGVDSEGADVEDDSDSAETAVESDEEDLDKLAELADNDSDAEAAEKIKAKAEELGIDADSIATWAEVVEQIKAGGAPEEAEEIKPSKGDTFSFKPPKAKKPVECEVTAVFEKNQTCNLKNLDDGKTVYKSVSWDSLISLE